MKSKINDVGKVLGGMKKAFTYRVMGMNVKRRLYEGVAVPNGAETWSMAVAEKRLNMMGMRCLRSVCEVMPMDRVRGETV